MEARKRAANKRRKLKSMGKSKSTETEEDDEDADEGRNGGFSMKHFQQTIFSLWIL